MVRTRPAVLSGVIGAAAMLGFLRTFLAPVADESSRPAAVPTATAVGLSAFPRKGPSAPLPATIRTPSGRVLQSGVVDPRGHRLPLDVEWAKPPRRPRLDHVPPTPGTVDRTGVPFPEHRLGPDDGHTQNETTITAVGDTIIAGWNSYTDDSLVMGVSRSVSGGDTWTFDLFSGHSAMSDPALRAGGNGRWYYGYLASGGPGGSDVDIYVRTSTDAGLTWGSPVDASQSTSFDDKPYIDADADHVVAAWADFAFSPARVTVSSSTNGAVSFGGSTVLAENSVGGNGACPVISPDGTWHVFWRDSFQESLWVSTSVDLGGSWSTDRGITPMDPLPSTLPGGFRIVNLPSADAHPVNGTLLVLWNDQIFGDPDIVAVRSVDGGQTWSVPVRVNDDAGTAEQWFPWVTFDPTGIAHAVWYDRRNDTIDIDVYSARSLDGGATWETNVRVTAQSFTAVLPSESGAPDFIGDYNGIAATATTAYPFYQDGRRGEQDVYVTLIPSNVVDVATPDEPATRARILRAAPNPFQSTTEIFVSDAGEAFTMEIVDARGRLVCRLGGVTSSVVWDGRDQAGRDVSPGVYFARLQTESGVRSMRVVRR